LRPGAFEELILRDIFPNSYPNAADSAKSASNTDNFKSLWTTYNSSEVSQVSAPVKAFKTFWMNLSRSESILNNRRL